MRTQQEQRIEQAQLHIKEMNTKYAEEIKFSKKYSGIYGPDFETTAFGNNVKPKLHLLCTDTVTAILNAVSNADFSKVCALNFASYKHPGGKFINGSMAQEEALCHESTLFNVLVQFRDTYYDRNRSNLNYAMYTNRAIYSPDIVFERGMRSVKCDIITCAAPNWKAAQRYGKVVADTNRMYLAKRIEFIMDVAQHHKVHTLIMGAFGCGVFGQNPEDVINIIHDLVNKDCYTFDNIIMAVPDRTSNNYKVFADKFKEFGWNE